MNLDGRDGGLKQKRERKTFSPVNRHFPRNFFFFTNIPMGQVLPFCVLLVFIQIDKLFLELSGKEEEKKDEI